MGNFEGIFATPITPFNKQENIYEQGLRSVVQFVNLHGVNNLFCLGSWGGFALMNFSERKCATEILISECKKQGMKIIINVASTTTREACLLAEHAQENGADAIASLVPYYYSASGYREENYTEYFKTLIKSVSIPVHFYNNPRTTGYVLTLPFFEKLLDIGVSGMKEGSGNQAFFIEMMSILENQGVDFDMIPGSVTMFMLGLMYGVKATMVGSAVVFPELAVEAFESYRKGDISKAVLLHSKMMEIRRLQGSCGMGVVSCYDLLKARGVDAGGPRRPWQRLKSQDLSIIINQLREAGMQI